MSTVDLHIVRSADQWVGSKVAAKLCSKSVRWVQDNKDRFKFRRKKKKWLEFELSSVLELRQELLAPETPLGKAV